MTYIFIVIIDARVSRLNGNPSEEDLNTCNNTLSLCNVYASVGFWSTALGEINTSLFFFTMTRGYGGGDLKY